MPEQPSPTYYGSCLFDGSSLKRLHSVMAMGIVEARVRWRARQTNRDQPRQALRARGDRFIDLRGTLALDLHSMERTNRPSHVDSTSTSCTGTMHGAAVQACLRNRRIQPRDYSTNNVGDFISFRDLKHRRRQEHVLFAYYLGLAIVWKKHPPNYLAATLAASAFPGSGSAAESPKSQAPRARAGALRRVPRTSTPTTQRAFNIPVAAE